MAERASKTATNMAVRHYLAQAWRLRRWSIPALVSVSIGMVLTMYVPPLIVAAAIKRFNGTLPDLHQLLPYLLVFGGIWLGGELIWRVAFLCLQRLETKAMNNLYVYALDELSKKDIGFFHDNFAGSLTKKTIGYGRSFEGFFDTVMFNIVANVVPLIFVAIVLWRFSPWLVVVLFSSVVLALLVILPLIKKRQKIVDAREAASNVMAGHVADVIGNMDAVQTFAHEAHEQRRHEKNVKDYTDKMLWSWDYHQLHIDLKISPMYVLINVAGLALAVLLGHDGVTIAAVFITFNYYAQVTHMLWEFNRTYRNLENAVTEAAQFTELLLVPSKIQEVKNPKPFAVTKGAVSFKNVHFSYNTEQENPLFAGFNLDIKPGEKIALVGHSGGGKTTVTKLLLRFMDVTSGELLIDGQNVAEARLKDVRSAIAYVPQDPAMFHRSIADNIRYGKLEATDAQVIEAAKKAHADGFIGKLTHGYETMVGERGIKLSGGQRQRIAIARAIIKDAPILILDEATSALDSASEKLIQAALWQLMSDRTAIVIAHRLSTIQKMDRIIVLDEGTIAEQGTHQELLDQNGIYATLWGHQSGGFIKD